MLSAFYILCHNLIKIFVFYVYLISDHFYNFVLYFIIAIYEFVLYNILCSMDSTVLSTYNKIGHTY